MCITLLIKFVGKKHGEKFGGIRDPMPPMHYINKSLVLKCYNGKVSNSCLFILTCGRKEYIQTTIASWEANLLNFDGKKIVFDDSGNSEYRQWLSDNYPDYELVTFSDDNVGLAIMLNSIAKYFSTNRYENLLMLEEDWELTEPVKFDTLVKILDKEKTLQVRLTVGPWFQKDFDYGGRLEFCKSAGTYKEKNAYIIFNKDTTDFMWSNNPSVFKSRVFTKARVIPAAEYYFGEDLKERYKTYVYYPKHPVVKHIGKMSSIHTDMVE